MGGQSGLDIISTLRLGEDRTTERPVFSGMMLFGDICYFILLLALLYFRKPLIAPLCRLRSTVKRSHRIENSQHSDTDIREDCHPHGSQTEGGE